MTAMRKPEVSQVHRQDGGPWAENRNKGRGNSTRWDLKCYDKRQQKGNPNTHRHQ